MQFQTFQYSESRVSILLYQRIMSFVASISGRKRIAHIAQVVQRDLVAPKLPAQKFPVGVLLINVFSIGTIHYAVRQARSQSLYNIREAGI